MATQENILNFGLVLILSPTGCTEGYVYFPQSCRNTRLPHFLDCLLNTTLIPCLLVFFLSILHERVCDYSRVRSSVTGILRMGDMNIHITWLTHVRTGPKKKNRVRAPDTICGTEVDTICWHLGSGANTIRSQTQSASILATKYSHQRKCNGQYSGNGWTLSPREQVYKSD